MIQYKLYLIQAITNPETKQYIKNKARLTHIASLALFPSTEIVFTLKSTPGEEKKVLPQIHTPCVLEMENKINQTQNKLYLDSSTKFYWLPPHLVVLKAHKVLLKGFCKSPMTFETTDSNILWK